MLHSVTSNKCWKKIYHPGKSTEHNPSGQKRTNGNFGNLYDYDLLCTFKGKAAKVKLGSIPFHKILWKSTEF